MSQQRSGSSGSTDGAKRIALAVAQTTLVDDPHDVTALRVAGAEVRKLMREAADGGARLVLFPEGAMCAPNKRIVSSVPDGWVRRTGPASSRTYCTRS